MSVAGGNDKKAYFYKFDGGTEQFQLYMEEDFDN